MESEKSEDHQVHAKPLNRVVDMVDPGRVRMDEARKSSGIPRPLPLIRYRERGGGVMVVPN